MKAKPVIIFDEPTDEYWNYEYQFSKVDSRHNWIGFASDSLINLKKIAKESGYNVAYISAKEGCFSYGQNLVDEYPYCPRYC